MQAGYVGERPLGYVQLTGIATATAFSAVPEGAVLALITPSVQAVRWRDDGVNPTSSLGYPLAVGVELQYSAQAFTRLRFIEQVAGAILDVVFYG